VVEICKGPAYSYHLTFWIHIIETALKISSIVEFTATNLHTYVSPITFLLSFFIGWDSLLRRRYQERRQKCHTRNRILNKAPCRTWYTNTFEISNLEYIWYTFAKSMHETNSRYAFLWSQIFSIKPTFINEHGQEVFEIFSTYGLEMDYLSI
jgi:hypothetical protein